MSKKACEWADMIANKKFVSRYAYPLKITCANDVRRVKVSAALVIPLDDHCSMPLLLLVNGSGHKIMN